MGIVLLLCLSFVYGYDTSDDEGYYSFDDDDLSGNVLDDLSLADNDVVNNGGVTGITGILNQAFGYSANNFTAKRPYSISSPEGCISIWFNQSDVSAEEDLYSIQQNGLGAFIALRILSGTPDKLDFIVHDTSTRIAWNFALPSDDDWHNIIVSVNDTKNSVWLDGVKQSPAYTTGKAGNTNWTDDISSMTTLIIGARNNTNPENGFNGDLDEMLIRNISCNQGDVDELYNSGAGFNPYAPPPPPVFALTIQNVFNSSGIDGFGVEITNSTFAENISTANGTVNWPNDQIINITIQKIDGVEGIYFNQTVTNYNTSTDLQVDTWQSVLIVDSQEILTALSILNFNMTVNTILEGSQFNISNSSGNATFLLNSGDYNFTTRLENFDENLTGDFTAPHLQTLFLTLNVSSNVLNVTARNKQGFGTINNFNVSIGSLFNSTTTGSLLIQCPSTGCNISLNATGFIPQIFLDHNSTINSTILVNLTNSTNILFFNNSLISSGISGANVTIISPLGRTLDLTTDVNGRVTFDSLNGEIFDVGNYSITLNSFQGFTTPITFYEFLNYSTAPLNSTYNITTAFILINIYDRETGGLLTKFTQIVIQNYFNSSTSNGTLAIQNLTIAAGDLTIIALSAGYGTEESTVTYTSQDNLTVNFYLLNSTGSNTGTHFVSALNELYITQPDTLVIMYEYDLALLSFIKVSECLTNSNGECSFLVELDQKKYIFTGSKTINGQEYTDSTISSGLFITIDNDFTSLFLKLLTEFQTTEFTQLTYDIDHNLEFVNNFTTNTSSVNVSFSTIDGGSTTVCVEYFIIGGGNSTSLNQTCSIGSSGIIQTSEDLNRSLSYNVQVYQFHDSYKVLILDKDIQRIISFGKELDDDKLLSPFILVPHLLLLVFALYSKNILFFLGGEPFIIWFEAIKFPSIAFMSIAALITFVCIVLFKIALKKRTEQP